MVGTDLQNRLSISLMHKNSPKRKLNIDKNCRFKVIGVPVNYPFKDL